MCHRKIEITQSCELYPLHPGQCTFQLNHFLFKRTWVKKDFCYFYILLLFCFTLSDFYLKQIAKCWEKSSCQGDPGLPLSLRPAGSSWRQEQLFRGPCLGHLNARWPYPLLSTEISRSCGMGRDPSTLYLDATFTEDRHGGGGGWREGWSKSCCCQIKATHIFRAPFTSENIPRGPRHFWSWQPLKSQAT